MVKFSDICSKLGLDEKPFKEKVDFSNIISKYIDGELYVDENDFYEKVGFNESFQHLPNLSLKDMLYFDNIGLFDTNVNKIVDYMYILNQHIEKNGKEYEIYPLMKYTSLVKFVNENEFIFTVVDYENSFYEYILHLIESVKKINSSKINMNDIMEFHFSDKEKVFNNDIVFVNKNGDEYSITSDEFENFTIMVFNYISYILPNYLPQNINVVNDVIGLIQNFIDVEYSIKFTDVLIQKSNEIIENYFDEMKKVS